MKSLVTTGHGDSGQTSTLDGETIEKDHPITEALGALDTMRTHIALLRAQLQEQHPEACREIDFLLYILHTCFLIGSAVSDPHNRKPEWHPVRLTPVHLGVLEAEQTRLEEGLNLPRSFIVCASNALAAQADVAVSAIRTFERRFVVLRREYAALADPVYGAFVNRLSDYFFILARHFDRNQFRPLDYSVVQVDSPAEKRPASEQ